MSVEKDTCICCLSVKKVSPKKIQQNLQDFITLKSFR